MKESFKKIWEGYKSFLKAFGKFNLGLISFLLYFLIFPLLRLVFLVRRNPKLDSTWQKTETIYPESHEHQF